MFLPNLFSGKQNEKKYIFYFMMCIREKRTVVTDTKTINAIQSRFSHNILTYGKHFYQQIRHD